MTKVLVTCDVECFLGHTARTPPLFRPWPIDACIYGRHGNESWGIERQMDQLEARDMRGTFYLSALQHRFYGEDAMAEVARRIGDRGHEVAVHTHCAWAGFRPGGRYQPGFEDSDSLCDHTEDSQRRLLAESIDCIERWSGQAAVSFRAGNFGADQTTLRLLSEMGVKTDSSRNRARGFLDELPTLNAPITAFGLLEVPVTHWRALRAPGVDYRRFVDPSNMTHGEATRVFDAIADAGVQTLVLVIHSFQYVLPGHVDRRSYRPRPKIVGRVDAILDYLHRDERFVPATMSELAEAPDSVIGGADVVPRVPAWLTASRLLQSWRDGR